MFLRKLSNKQYVQSVKRVHETDKSHLKTGSHYQRTAKSRDASGQSRGQVIKCGLQCPIWHEKIR